MYKIFQKKNVITTTMADIVNSTMFTNCSSAVLSCNNSTDLLQQAFRGAVDAQENGNEFMSFYTNDGSESQTIYLTEEQAAALRLNFEVDTYTEDQATELSYQQCGNDVFNGLNDANLNSSTLPENYEHWTLQDVKDNGESNVIMSVKTFDMPNVRIQSPEEFINNSNEHVHQSNISAFLVQQAKSTCLKASMKNTEANGNGIYLTTDNKNTRQKFPIIPPAQSQLLGKLPVIMPSSQLIFKPTQTILKSAKNIRIYPNANKVTGNNKKIINSSIAGFQNSILIPKATSVNSGSTQTDSSQILLCDLNGQSSRCGNTSNLTINGNARTVQSLGSAQIRVSPWQSSVIMQREAANQLKSTVRSVVETTSTPKSSISTNVSSGQLLKSLNIPSGLLKSAAANVTEGLNVATPGKTTVTPMIIRSGSRVKTKVASTTPRSSLQTPISILKSQTKVPVTSCRQNATTNLPKNVSINGKVAKPSPQTVDMKSVDGKSESTAKITKVAKLVNPQYDHSLVDGQTDSTRPLGTSENPIQIVQQGQTFHSMQRLTQSQLKQIANVLQQKSQDSLSPNEKVVYRVVFPEELDLRIRSPINLLKGRGGKRGRPKKKPPSPLAKSAAVEEDSEELKGERKKPVARTRSGRLSRPPRHMVRDYKHLNPLDVTQPDLDDSDGGYSDYNVDIDTAEVGEGAKDLLTGYECPKRKISDHFRCPTCSKIYLGRTRMMKHFEVHPDHGSLGQLPPRTVEPEPKRSPFPPDLFKRKGKKRGPWAYITPEAKSERRQVKLNEALSACNSDEILKIAAKPVLDAQSIFQLMVLKSDNCLKTFLSEFKTLIHTAREQINSLLSPVNTSDDSQNLIDLDSSNVLCAALGLDSNRYKISDDIQKSENFQNTAINDLVNDEPPLKIRKFNQSDEKKNINEKISSNFSSLSQIDISKLMMDKKTDLIESNCPEVLTALTLMPRNSSPITTELIKTNNISKLLITNPDIQNQLSENSPGFQKIQISQLKNSTTFKNINNIKNEYNELNNDNNLNVSSDFSELKSTFEQSKMNNLHENFQKIENNISNNYETNSNNFSKLQDNFNEKLISKINTISSEKNILPMIQVMTPCDTSIFGSTENLDISKISNYDLDILSNNSVVMDEKLVEQLNLVDQSNLVDELVSERLKNIMPDTILDNNLINNPTNLDADLDFEALSEEFNRNTTS